MTEASPNWDQDDIDNEMFRDDDDCDHVQAEVDCLEGILRCHCGYRRVLSGEELKREIHLQAQLYEDFYVAMDEGAK